MSRFPSSDSQAPGSSLPYRSEGRANPTPHRGPPVAMGDEGPHTPLDSGGGPPPPGQQGPANSVFARDTLHSTGPRCRACVRDLGFFSGATTQNSRKEENQGNSTWEAGTRPQGLRPTELQSRNAITNAHPRRPGQEQGLSLRVAAPFPRRGPVRGILGQGRMLSRGQEWGAWGAVRAPPQAAEWTFRVREPWLQGRAWGAWPSSPPDAGPPGSQVQGASQGPRGCVGPQPQRPQHEGGRPRVAHAGASHHGLLCAPFS